MSKAKFKDIRKNIMGTTTFEMKAAGMRKSQEFIVYPIRGNDEGQKIRIQSDNRFGIIDLKKKIGIITGHCSGHPNLTTLHIHLSEGTAKSFKLSNLDNQTLKLQIFTSSNGKAGNNGVMHTDNSGAKKVL